LLKLRMIAIVFSICWLAACGPSPLSTQAALPANQAAGTPISISTGTPLLKTIYILETGFCDSSVGRVSSRVDPKTVQNCHVSTRRDAILGSTQAFSITKDSSGGKLEVYCALFNWAGKFMVSATDTTGSGNVICRP
jgi:hypothetical protein